MPAVKAPLLDAAGNASKQVTLDGELVASWAPQVPLVVVTTDGEEALAKSFRNLPRTAVVAPSELEVSAVVWARSLIVSQAALEDLLRRAGANGAKEEEAAE